MTFDALKCSTCLLMFFAIILLGNAQCPDLCFCNRQTADQICGVSSLTSNCEVGRCSKSICSSGWACQEKVLKNPVLLSQAKVTEIRAKIEKAGGCKGNVCFSIDGSTSIPASNYANEQQFVVEVVNIISTFDVRVGGTQYNEQSNPISPLTEDLLQFTIDVAAAKQLGGSTSISSGIEFCASEFKNTVGQANKVVVLGDGFQNVDQNAVPAADAIRSSGGLVSAVVEGTSINNPTLLAIAGNNQELVFETKFSDVVALAFVIENLTIRICGN